MNKQPGLLKSPDMSQISRPHNHLQSLFDGFVNFSGVKNCDVSFNGLSLNSKKVHEGFLFLACASVANRLQHGVAYAGEAINNGATCVAWEPTEDLKDMPATCPLYDADNVLLKTVPLLKVEHLHEHLGEIAARFYQHPSRSMHVTGITGTNGKTSTAHFIAHLQTHLSGSSCAVIGTLGNGLYGHLQHSTHTTPDAVTLQSLLAQYQAQQAQALVMEVSSHALSQGRVNAIEYDCAVFTNLTRDHLDYHGDMQSYAKEKLKLFHWASLNHIVINKDDDFAQTIIDSLSATQQTERLCISTCSSKDASADYFAKAIAMTHDGLSFCLHTGSKDYTVKTQLVGDFSIDNLLAAIAVVHQRGFDIPAIVTALQSITTIPGRMEKVTLPESAYVSNTEQPLVVVDYAHTPDALEQALKALKTHTQGRLHCVFGCGGDRDKGKRPLMAAIAQQQADRVVLTSDNPRTEAPQAIIDDILKGFEAPEQVLVEVDRGEAIYKALQALSSDDVLLIAGKGHEDYQEVNGVRFPFSDQQTVLSFYQQVLQAGKED